MNIDWLTLIAQIINFLILVFLLKHFLYDRVVKAMDEREERITSRFDEAEKEKNEAKKMRRDYEDKLGQIGDKRQEILSGAHEEAETRKKEMIREARYEVDKMKRSWQDALEKERDNLIKDIRRNTGQQIYAVARRALSDLSDQELEKQMLDVFIDRIEEMDNDEFNRKLNISDGGKKGITVTTNFDIHGNTQKRIREIISKKTRKSNKVEFETTDKMICGIEITTGGRSISWSIDRYLDDIENRFLEVLSLKDADVTGHEETEKGKESKDNEKSGSDKESE